MVKHIKSEGRNFKVEFFEVIDEGKTGYYVNEQETGYWKYHRTKVYYRPERTWDDHMGNTPCGYYVIVPFPTGERKRVYMF